MKILPKNNFNSKSLSFTIEESVESYLKYLKTNDPQYLYRQVIKPVEYSLLKTVISNTSCNQSKTARLLGMHRSTLHKKLKLYDLL